MDSETSVDFNFNILDGNGQKIPSPNNNIKKTGGDDNPPKKPESVVYTFTEHYMWGLSWYADLYQREGCLDAAG